MITAEKARTMLDYNHETGEFRWKHQPGRAGSWNSRLAGKIAGYIDKRGYRRIHVDGRTYLAHRLAWLYVHGKWPNPETDHINGDPSDNRIQNLREATSSQNGRNRPHQKNNKIGLKGVYYHERDERFISRIYLNGRQLHLGCFRSAHEAHEAYCEAAKKFHGEYANTGASA